MLFGITQDKGSYPSMVCPWFGAGNLNEYLRVNPTLSLDDRFRLVSTFTHRKTWGCSELHRSYLKFLQDYLTVRRFLFRLFL